MAGGENQPSLRKEKELPWLRDTEELRKVTQCFTEQRPATDQRSAVATSGLRWEKWQIIFHLVDLPFSQWNIQKQKAASSSCLLLFIHKQEDVLETKSVTLSDGPVLFVAVFGT